MFLLDLEKKFCFQSILQKNEKDGIHLVQSLLNMRYCCWMEIY